MSGKAMKDDYYQILGVLPSAEAIVITAAYRALASQYHPDRWKGDPATANKKMAEINVAYEVLGNPEKRKSYDESRNASHSTYEEENDTTDDAFAEAMSEQEAKWQLACDVFPDLTDTRKRLAKTSHRLAFAFVTLMLETKNFNARHQIAEKMEHSFLELHFGTNAEIVAFAKKLIVLGHKKAIVALNNYVDVLGSDTAAKPIIDKIQKEFHVSVWEQELNARVSEVQRRAAAAARDQEARERMAAAAELKKQEAEREKIRERQKFEAAERQKEFDKLKVEELKSSVRIHRKYPDAFELLIKSGYQIETKSQGFFKPSIIDLFKIGPEGNRAKIKHFDSNGQLVIWVVDNLCR
jgi:curved DNA-binding protein CbpA